MSKFCDVCGRGPKASVSVSHAKNTTKRTLNVNLQSKKVDGQRKKVCTKCIKTMNKVK
jgi:large subunit ribosomal protein L28